MLFFVGQDGPGTMLGARDITMNKTWPALEMFIIYWGRQTNLPWDTMWQVSLWLHGLWRLKPPGSPCGGLEVLSWLNEGGTNKEPGYTDSLKINLNTLHTWTHVIHLSLWPFYRWQNWGTEKLSDLSKVTQTGKWQSWDPGSWFQRSFFQPPCYNVSWIKMLYLGWLPRDPDYWGRSPD